VGELGAPKHEGDRYVVTYTPPKGRHLWAMVYLLHQYFGKDGREEAEDLLVRRSGHQDSPRILSTFNKPIEDWLSFFCFAMFTDRDGKYQLGALAESGFDPLARTTQFMLTEEAHHLFVGETGVGRVVARTAQLMKECKNSDVTIAGGIPLDIIQKYINEWYSSSLDLFGSEDSSNAAAYFATGLKGRFHETKSPRITDHVALEGQYQIEKVDSSGKIEKQDPAAPRHEPGAARQLRRGLRARRGAVEQVARGRRPPRSHSPPVAALQPHHGPLREPALRAGWHAALRRGVRAEEGHVSAH
jgi:benzoyl-CoA oxygenase B subunit